MSGRRAARSQAEDSYGHRCDDDTMTQRGFIALCSVTLVQAYLLVSVFPYSAYLVVHLCKDVTIEEAGPYAASLATAFMLGRTIASQFWVRRLAKGYRLCKRASHSPLKVKQGNLADVYGRSSSHSLADRKWFGISLVWLCVDIPNCAVGPWYLWCGQLYGWCDENSGYGTGAQTQRR